jgi:hypothetical protein
LLLPTAQAELRNGSTQFAENAFARADLHVDRPSLIVLVKHFSRMVWSMAWYATA